MNFLVGKVVVPIGVWGTIGLSLAETFSPDRVMGTRNLPLVVASILLASPVGYGQPPADVKALKVQAAPALPDEARAIVKEIEEAYKAPLEVHEDVLDELRKQYKDPTPKREAKLFYEIRRLYNTTPEQEAIILQEVRKAYYLQSREQELRLFGEIDKVEKLPLGTVHPVTQAEQAGKLFQKLDHNGDGILGPDEVTETLRGQQRRWDRNRDGIIDATEYGAFFQSHHQVVADAVAAGEIPLKLPKGITGPNDTLPASGPRPDRGPAKPNLPAWYAEYDTDGDGQVGLYEWRKQGKTIAEFARMDVNEDGYLSPRELTSYLAAQPKGTTPGKPTESKVKVVETKR